MKTRCRVQMYDPTVTEPPFEFITLDEFECNKPENDNLGEQFYRVLWETCLDMGYVFKFYSMSNHDDFDFDVTVHPI